MYKWYEFKKRYRCPHVNLQGLYGDAIYYIGDNKYRNLCLDCGKLLDGPVSISVERKSLETTKRVSEAVSIKFDERDFQDSVRKSQDSLEAITISLKPIATEDMLERHAEKQDCSYADAWKVFRNDGYDMSQVHQYKYFGDEV